MKRKLCERIVEVLKQAELGLPVADLISKVGISEQTFYLWKTQYAGLGSDQVREFAQLFEENARLKELLVVLSLDNAVLQDNLSKKLPSSR
jgi:putative transposase